MSAQTVAHHAVRTAAEESPRRGWFSRLREWWIVMSEPVPYDWTEPEAPAGAAAMQARPATDPAHVQTEAPSGETVEMQVPSAPQEPRPEPPLVYMPAPPQDVLRNLGILAMDLLGRDVTSQDVLDRLARHIEELEKRVRQAEHLERRSVSNVAETQMDAGLLAAAARRGESPEELEQRAARMRADMVARARHASDPTPTGTLPQITEETPEPTQEMPAVEVEPDHPWTPTEEGVPERAAAAAEIERQQREATRVDEEYVAELERRGREFDADARKSVAA